MNKRVLWFLAFFALPSLVFAQAGQAVRGQPMDPDDASIATGQTNTNTNALNMWYDGSVWRRITFGTAGTASAQVLTVQGIALGTNLNVNCQAGCSGGTQFAEDAAHVSGDLGTAALAIRRDTTPASSSGTAGDYSLLNVDGNGRLYTNTTLYDASGNALSPDTQITQDGALTVGSTTGGANFARASAAAPTDVSADNDGVLLWALRSGALAIQPTFGGVLTSTGLGAAGTGTQRVVDVASGSTGSAPPTQASYQAGVGGGATGGLLASVTVCDSQAFLDMTTATTTELVALTASRKIYVCYWLAESNGTTVMTFKRGTGSNCGTGTTTISNAWDLTAQVGFSGGGGVGAIFDNQNAGDALCVTNSGTVNLHIFVRYAKY